MVRLGLAYVLLLCILAGCGGDASIVPDVPPSKASLTMEVAWPAITRLIPKTSRSVVIHVVQDEERVGEQVLERDRDEAHTAAATFDGLEPGEVKVAVLAYPGLAGEGFPQARKEFVFELAAGEHERATAALESTVVSIEAITPHLRGSLYSVRHLNLRAVDAFGHYVVTNLDGTTVTDFSLRTADPSIATIESYGDFEVRINGHASGTTNVIAAIPVDDTGRTVETTIPLEIDMSTWSMAAEFPVEGATTVENSPSGGFYVSRAMDGEEWIEEFAADGQSVRRWGSLSDVSDLHFDSRDGHLYVLERGNHRVLKYTADGTFLLSIGSEQLTAPTHVATNPTDVFVGDPQGLFKFSKSGTFVGQRMPTESGLIGLGTRERDFITLNFAEETRVVTRTWWSNFQGNAVHKTLPGPSAPTVVAAGFAAFPESGCLIAMDGSTVYARLGSPATMRPVDMARSSSGMWVLSAIARRTATVQRWDVSR